jgi:anti-sigma B factor antagonist
MQLKTSQRYIEGKAVVLDCEGRIILGEEAQKLQSEVAGLVADRCDVVVNLEKVTHIDSSGLGVLLKLVTTARAAGNRVVFASPAPHVQNLFRITQLYTAMDIYGSVEEALRAARTETAGAAASNGRTVFCVEPSADMLAFFTGVLKTAGYQVTTTRHYPDALLLLKAQRPDAVLFGPGAASPRPTDAEREFRQMASSLPRLELEPDFAAGDAAQNSAALLARLHDLLPQT